MQTGTLRYPLISEQTGKRWQAVLTSRRPLSDRARQLLGMAMDACDSTGPAGLQSRWFNQALWIRCDHQRLAELLKCSDRTIRREIAELAEIGVLRAVKATQDTPSGPREIVAYAVSLERLEALREPDPTPELDALIVSCPDPFEADSEPAAEPVSGGLSAALSGGLSAGLSGALSGGLSALMSMNHEHEYKTHDMNHDHESFGNSSEETQSPPREPPIAVNRDEVRFTAISPDDVRRIVRQNDGQLFAAYFADAVSAGWAKDCESERVKLAGLFSQVVRVGKARNPGATIAGSWKRRVTRPLQLSAADEDFARKLIRLPPSPSSPAAAAPRPLRMPVLQSPDDFPALAVQRAHAQSQIRQLARIGQ